MGGKVVKLTPEQEADIKRRVLLSIRAENWLKTNDRKSIGDRWGLVTHGCALALRGRQPRGMPDHRYQRLLTEIRRSDRVRAMMMDNSIGKICREYGIGAGRVRDIAGIARRWDEDNSAGPGGLANLWLMGRV